MELKDFLDLSYTAILRRDEDGDFVARIDELPGCSAHGHTQGEALERLEEAKRLWIEDAIENGHSVPVPAAEAALPSGKWVQRVPRSLHKKLTSLAKTEGVSLNQIVTSILAGAVGSHWSTGADTHRVLRYWSAAISGIGTQWKTCRMQSPDWSCDDLSQGRVKALKLYEEIQRNSCRAKNPRVKAEPDAQERTYKIN